MLKKYKNLILINLFFINSLISYSFRIDNIDFDQRIDKDGYQEYRIHNDSMKRIRYKVFLKDLEDLPVSKALEVYPKVITIEPKSYGVLKVFGKGGIDLPNKEYKFKMGFKPIIIPTLAKSSGKKEVISGNTIIPLVPDIVMKGYVGEIDFSKHLFIENITFHKNKDKKLVAKLTLKNTAYAGLNLGLNFYNAEKNVMDSKAIGRISKNSVINVEVELNSFKDNKDIKYIEFYNSSIGSIVEKKI